MQGPDGGIFFNSLQYAGFLVIVVAAYWLLARLPAERRDPARRILLLVASYLFYATFSWQYCLLLALVTAANFVAGRQITSATTDNARRAWLGGAMAVTLGALVVFKYLGFLGDLVAALAGILGLHIALVVSLVLPLGISFYTLHTLSYTIDVYRRELEPTDDVVAFGLFVAYFPQLLAGPLTRGRRMLPQFAALPARANGVQWAEGLELILIGLFQKVAVADALAPFTTRIFSETSQPTGGSRNMLLLLVALGASVIQFVLDFAGYSNIARGSSKLLGIELPYNFRQPITRSRNFQDYWRRHNMTLMAWLRDYVLRPLRRRSDSAARSSFLLVLVFTVSGLWHGATWGWLLWGLFVGVWVAAEIAVNRYREADRRARAEAEALATGVVAVAAPPRTAARRLLGQIGASTYCVAVLGFSMVLFRSPNISSAFAFYREVFSFGGGAMDWDNLLLFLYAVVAVVVVDHREHRMELAEGKADPPTIPRAVLWGTMLVLIVVWSGGAMQPFVYFQF